MSTTQTFVRLYQGPTTLGALFTGEPVKGQYVAVVARDAQSWQPHQLSIVKSFDTMDEAIQYAKGLDTDRYSGISVSAFADGWSFPADAPTVWDLENGHRLVNINL